MSAALAFVGDELSAAGYRLAGVATFVPAAGEEYAMLERARSAAALVLVTAEVAARLPAAALAAAQAATAPLLLIVPDVRARVPAPDLGRLIRSQLGIEA
jgi:vacuolar-type H+-ATPase subunit F/Vma7